MQNRNDISVRKDWLNRMLLIADPVILHLAEDTLKENMPTVFHPDRVDYMHLEALGRTLLGLAPWLELEQIPAEEKELQQKYRTLVRQGLSNAVNPQAKDYMNFTEGYGQALVDAAFLAHAIVRAPKQLYEELPETDKKNLICALKQTRKFTPFVSNWIFFSAMIETALYVMGEPDYDLTRVEYAVRMFLNWYVGDGTYGDGDFFHWDYYNSFVIQPMFVDILQVFSDIRPDYRDLAPTICQRASRYAGILEQMIGPDGSYTVIGRSVTYRFGAFHALSQAVLQDNLPSNLSNGQVRSALTTVLHKVMEQPMFDENGWLLPGIYGYQPDLAEGYICVGSLYLCCAVFLPLGLPEPHLFWQEPDADWTAKKIWSGQNVRCDHAMD